MSGSLKSDIIIYAKLCKESYAEDSKIGRKNSAGLEILDLYRDDDTGFFGIAAQAPGRIIIAFRGTDSLISTMQANSKSSVIADLSSNFNIIKSEIADQLKSAMEFYNQVREQYPDQEIELTGHSLGGAVVQMLAVNIYLSHTKSVETYAFDSPGIYKIVKDHYSYTSGCSNIHLINGAPNFINSFGRPLSQPNYYFTQTDYHGAGFKGFIEFSLDQHNINNIIKAIKSEKLIKFGYSYPTSLQLAYNFYTNYEQFNIYWKNVIIDEWRESGKHLTLKEFKVKFIEDNHLSSADDSILPSAVETIVQQFTDGETTDTLLVNLLGGVLELLNEFDLPG